MDNNNVQQPVGQQPEPGKGMATASMILGIVTLVMMFAIAPTFGLTGVIGVITGIIGIILGVSAKKKGATGMATAGIVMSAIGLGLSILLLVSCVLCIGAAAGGLNGLELNNFNLNNLNY